ncbi:MAG: hypothetical protein F6K54_15745 [Okeania sp. SIO3B5]|uniref:hypothetical protein n=1 Tax=Okeania sp. SIO3B5 TaxID=2607811 RepID=UPI001401B70B|nr:hypothetical protein [Okeania sp. SIO3B5]NEO54410.1 hypothetical protein [Okeania sp. SIO3B5]
MVNVSGSWLGTYWQQGNPTRFEATLIQGGNTLSGNILDDSYLGEAILKGEIIGRKISFTKLYLRNSKYIIYYVGTVAEDENFMQGKWQIGRSTSGIWEASRSNEDLMIELKNFLSKKFPISLS